MNALPTHSATCITVAFYFADEPACWSVDCSVTLEAGDHGQTEDTPAKVRYHRFGSSELLRLMTEAEVTERLANG